MEEEEGAKLLAEALAPEVVPFSSEVNERRFLSSWTAVGVTRRVETVAETPGKSEKNHRAEDNRCLPARF